MYDLKNDIFEPVANRISERAPSLSEICHLCANSGIEGWLKVEVVSALSGMVQSINNKGPDLTLTDGTQIELKGMTDFNADYIRKGCLWEHKECKRGEHYDDAPCLFLADGSKPERVNEIEDKKVEVIAYQIISDGPNNWIVGLAAPI